MYSNGITLSEKRTEARLWAPNAEEVKLHIYSDGESINSHLDSFNLKREVNGEQWYISIDKSLKDLFYTFQIKYRGELLDETPDPDVKCTGVNGKRGHIIDLNETNPEGWSEDVNPKIDSIVDAIIYEVHVRDFSISDNSGVVNRGKYLAFTESGSRTDMGSSTCVDHLKELGVTHVHLLPISDYYTVNESIDGPISSDTSCRRVDGKEYTKSNYNWGYDPQHFNSPEGSYSTDPHSGAVRVKEVKEMVLAMHKEGLGVILDVVYNHTGLIELSSFNLTAPGLYYRHLDNGEFSNASGCGSEIASEKRHVKEYIINSILYWATEYHIDGFRFDLMGILDIDTINSIRTELDKIDPNIVMYGEGWCADYSPLNENLRAVKESTFKLDRVASFCDDFRDAVKGNNFNNSSRGFVNGEQFKEEHLKFGIVGAVEHPQVDFNHINSSSRAWAISPQQCINYISCHDNYTLFDKLRAADPYSDIDIIKEEVKLSMALLLTSQGVPLIHGGSEFLRDKKGEHNSYNLPDSINEIDWSNKDRYRDVFKFIKELINFRKENSIFRLRGGDDVRSAIKFAYHYVPGTVSYTIKGRDGRRTLLIFNGNRYNVSINTPEIEEDNIRWREIFNMDGKCINGDSRDRTELEIIDSDTSIVKLKATAFTIMQEQSC